MLFKLAHFLKLTSFFQRWYAQHQVKNCYASFTMQFDQLHEGEVIWEPYDHSILAVRFPSGISPLCMRDQGYWYTKAFLVFDVIVEEMAQQKGHDKVWSATIVKPSS